MKSMKRKALVKKLKKIGAEAVRCKGSHELWRLGSLSAVVPHGLEVAPGTLRDILKQLNLSF